MSFQYGGLAGKERICDRRIKQRGIKHHFSVHDIIITALQEAVLEIPGAEGHIIKPVIISEKGFHIVEILIEHQPAVIGLCGLICRFPVLLPDIGISLDYRLRRHTGHVLNGINGPGRPIKIPALPSVNCVIASHALVAAASWKIQPLACHCAIRSSVALFPSFIEP